jgi:hypothetical protein
MLTKVAIVKVLGSAVFLTRIALSYLSRRRRRARDRFLRLYVFPASVLDQLTKQYPRLVEQDRQQAIEALRDFFLVRLRAGDRLLGMPSRIVDDLWHAFILGTREYKRFCDGAFGRFFHHVPASANPPDRNMQVALRMTYRLARKLEGIHGRSRLPRLFVIDTELKSEGGQSFVNWLFSPSHGGIFVALGLPESDQRLWFVVDELDALGAIDGLKDALARYESVGEGVCWESRASRRFAARTGMPRHRPLSRTAGRR